MSWSNSWGVRFAETASGSAAQLGLTIPSGMCRADIIDENANRFAWPSGNHQTIAGQLGDLVNREWIIEEGAAPVRIRLPRKH